jgi:quinol monooxygenase YgiN
MLGRLKRIKIFPGKEQEFEQLMIELIAQVRQYGAGNVYYDLYKDPDMPGCYIMMERYHDQSALQAHEQSAHGARLFPQIRSLIQNLEKETYESVG